VRADTLPLEIPRGDHPVVEWGQDYGLELVLKNSPPRGSFRVRSFQ